MAKKYTFKCYDDETDTYTEVSFSTDSELWSEYDGPMWKFFDFLKGCGFVFDMHDQIGIKNKKDQFRSATPDF